MVHPGRGRVLVGGSSLKGVHPCGVRVLEGVTSLKVAASLWRGDVLEGGSVFEGGRVFEGGASVFGAPL